MSPGPRRGPDAIANGLAVMSDGSPCEPYAIVKDLTIAAKNASAKLRLAAAKNAAAEQRLGAATLLVTFADAE